MEKYLKKLTIREDGFLEIQLKKIKDFDSYIFQQIQKDESCLPCIRDPHSKGKLFYDIKGYLSISEYLASHQFEKGEFTKFLVYVLRELVQANISKPVYLNVDYIYINYEAKMIHFLIIPLAMDRWIFEKDATSSFIKSLIDQVQSEVDYEGIGYLVQALKNDEIKLSTILQQLEEVLLNSRKKPTMIEKLLHLDKDDPYQVIDLPKPKTYAPSLQSFSPPLKSLMVNENSESYDATVDIFESDSGAFLLNVKNNEKTAISQQSCTIGRKDDNIIVIKNKGISSYHAAIENGKIEDLHSLNGTFVNQKKVNCYLLKDGDRISFGDTHFIYYEQARNA